MGSFDVSRFHKSACSVTEKIETIDVVTGEISTSFRVAIWQPKTKIYLSSHVDRCGAVRAAKDASFHYGVPYKPS